MRYRIYLGDDLVGSSDFLPAAQAAWDRAGKDTRQENMGAQASLLVDGQLVASAERNRRAGTQWPVPTDHVPGLRDVAHALLQLARIAGAPTAEVAEAMTANGLPTTTSRLKSISTIEQGRQSTVSAAELVVLCYAAISVLKSR